MSEAYETMLGYCLSKEGRHGKPIRIESREAMMEFISKNVEQFYELRVTDLDDFCTFQIVDRALIFPLPEGRPFNNVWDAKLQLFVDKVE